MKWVKKLWFPGVAVLLLAIIGINIKRVIDFQRAGNDASDANFALQNSGTRENAARAETPVRDLVGNPGPRTLTMRIQPKSGNGQPDHDQLIAALQAMGSVEGAVVVEGDRLKLTISDSLDHSELVERLGFQNAVLVEDDLALAGGLRLKIAGMT